MRVITALAAAALAGVANGIVHAQTAVTGERVVATVNGEEILASDVAAMYRSLPAQYQQVPMESLFPQMIDNLVSRKLVAEAARAAASLTIPRCARACRETKRSSCRTCIWSAASRSRSTRRACGPPTSG